MRGEVNLHSYSIFDLQTGLDEGPAVSLYTTHILIVSNFHPMTYRSHAVHLQNHPQYCGVVVKVENKGLRYSSTEMLHLLVFVILFRFLAI